MKALIALVLAVSTASATVSDDQVQHAAATVAKLHDSMLDPASFVLDSVFVTKPSKKGNVSYCYAFRSHNRMGGYSDGRAVEDGDDKLRLSVFTIDNGSGRFPGYDVGWGARCTAKNFDKDMTGEVSALASGLYKKAR